MSGWTILTVRAREGQNYDYSKYDDADRWGATADIVASMENDDRIYKWTTWKSHVYAYLDCTRYNFQFAEKLMEDYGEMIEDAVVLGANDTSDTGTARYYPRPDLGVWSDQYEEDQKQDGYFVGELALCVINSRHGILARDPFHNKSGILDDRYLDSGNNRINRKVAGGNDGNN